MAILGPFDESVATLVEGTGIRVPKRSVEEIVVDASADFDSFYARRTTATLPHGCILVGSIDCKGIPMVKAELAKKPVRMGKGQKRQKKRMSTVAAVFSQEVDVRSPDDVVENLFRTQELADRRSRRTRKPIRKRVWASLVTGKSCFINTVRQELLRRDPRRRRRWIIVTDGERALQKQVGQLLKDTVFVLDFLHVLEKLWTASYVFHAEGSSQAETFVRERALRILRGQVSQVVKGLRQMATKHRLSPQKRKLLHDVANYYYRNRQRMRYHTYLAKGYPIASGSVEGACKNLVKDRMERSGMRWTARTAEAILKLRAVYLSRDWDEYWNYHVEQELKRLYPQGAWQPH